MEKVYFNTYEFKQALDLMETDPITSRKLFEEYLEKYPKDYSAYPFYGSNLMILGEFESAEKILNFVEKKASEDEKFVKPDKVEIFKQNMFFGKVKLMCYQKKFKELYKIYKNNPMKLKNKDLNSVWFYAQKQLGKLNVSMRNVNSYLFRQITKYEESDFYDHIKKHLSDGNDNINSCLVTVFVPDFPINEVVKEIKKHIPSDKALFCGFFDNVYYFKYDECGRANNKLVNYIKVECFDGTNDIITLCPVIISDSIPHIDLNYMKKEELTKVKRISQIDKFNQRYNIKK